MKTYKLLPDTSLGKSPCFLQLPESIYIPFDPANTDYQTFKFEVAAGKAELQDAEGNLMTAEEAKAFVATLP